MTFYELKSIAILNVKGVDYRYILRGIIENEAVNILNNCVRRQGCFINGCWCK